MWGLLMFSEILRLRAAKERIHIWRYEIVAASSQLPAYAVYRL